MYKPNRGPLVYEWEEGHARQSTEPCDRKIESKTGANSQGLLQNNCLCFLKLQALYFLKFDGFFIEMDIPEFLVFSHAYPQDSREGNSKHKLDAVGDSFHSE